MKKDLFAKGVIGLSATSIIAASCSSESVWMDNDDPSEIESQFSDEGSPVINIKLSDEETGYLRFLNGLAADIIKEPAVAREFAKDPSAFVKQYGYQGKVNLDEGMLKLILALGDEDINTAVNQNDMTTAIALMENKGLLDDVSKSEIKIQFTKEEMRQIYEQMGLDFDEKTFGEKKGVSTAVAATVFYLAAAAIEWVAVGHTVAGAFNLAAYFTFVIYSEAYFLGLTERDVDGTIHRNLPLKIWSLKGQDANTYIAADKYVTDQAKKMMKLIKDNDPKALEKIDESQLEQILKLSIANAPIKK